MAKRSSRAARGTITADRGSERSRKASAPGPLERLSAWLGTPVGFTIAAAALVVLALAARLVTWRWIFGSGRVELVPADSHYYVRLARLHLEAGGPIPFDPFVGFPIGSENYWPPLHILLVSLLAAAGTDAEVAAAFAGPVATLLWLVPIAVVARAALGARWALLALFVLALTPIAVEAGKIGNADHNVHEPLLTALVLLLTTAAVRGSGRAALAAGALAGAARLFTTTGFVVPGVVAGGWLVAALLAPREGRGGLAGRAALSGAVAVGTLVIAVVALGHPGRLDYEALTLFHPLLASALFGIAVGVCAYREGRPRAALAGGACALAGLAVAPALLRAASHLARQDPLLAVVAESRPLAGDPGLALALLGPVLILLPFALVGAARPLLRRRAPELAPAAAATLVFVLGAAAQSRLAPFLIGAAAVLLPLGLPALGDALQPRTARWGGAGAALVLGTLLFMLVPPAPPATPAQASMIRPTLLWMRDHLPPASADPWDYHVRPSYGVLAPFDYGHFVTLYAERPVLASTFSQTDAHVEANRIADEILREADEERAFERVRELELAYVLAVPSRLFGAEPPAPDALLSRLLRRDSFGRFRPLFVSEERRPGGGRFATVFEVVEGAVLVGNAAPTTTVEARLEDGYARTAVADPAGEFRIRVSRPGPYLVTAGGRFVGVTEEQVRSGAEVSASGAGG
jgi:dolichyl-diphosphooligosaccharide--protein glycosyltransferase